jgi:hypothetical protein
MQRSVYAGCAWVDGTVKRDAIFEALTLAEIDKLFSGYQPCQLVKVTNQQITNKMTWLIAQEEFNEL